MGTFLGCISGAETHLAFLNIDRASALDSWTWRSAAQLYICTGPIKDMPNSSYWGVRKFIGPFKNLLRLAQVGEIQAVRPQAIPDSAPQDALASMLGAFNDMRANTELTDVAFVAGDDDSEDRMQFHAHRNFLVSRSPYFRGLFCGSFEEANPTNEPFTVEDCSVDCLKEILGKAVA